jgi:hypothetical protein
MSYVALRYAVGAEMIHLQEGELPDDRNLIGP